MALELGMITIDCANPQGLAEFWTAALGVTVEADYGPFVMLARPAGGGPALAFQQVPEPRAGKNRVHVDFGAPDPEAEVNAWCRSARPSRPGTASPGCRGPCWRTRRGTSSAWRRLRPIEIEVK
jgi:hypothetical protein